MANELRANHLVIHINSQFIVKQVMGEYEAVNDSLTKYCDLVRSLLRRFMYWELIQIEREANEIVDYLSRLVSTYFLGPSCDKNTIMPINVRNQIGSKKSKVTSRAETSHRIKHRIKP